MYKEIAIIAPTASGKTALSISLAHKINAVILSLDSLAVYKEIDIVSAKPTIEERDGIEHFGIDKFYPNEQFDVISFIKEYERAKKYALINSKNLIIVGGTGFYLKSMVDGISKFPIISDTTKEEVSQRLFDIEKSYNELYEKDMNYMKKIDSNDRYRIEKALEIYLETKLTPTEYFEQNKPEPILDQINIFEIETNPDVLRNRIKLRTKNMIQNGMIDEVIMLEQKYTREPNCMGSIGIIETLSFLDGKINKNKLEELISVHTAQFAKRQRTFNRSQFKNVIKENLDDMEKRILNILK